MDSIPKVMTKDMADSFLSKYTASNPRTSRLTDVKRWVNLLQRATNLHDIDATFNDVRAKISDDDQSFFKCKTVRTGMDTLCDFTSTILMYFTKDGTADPLIRALNDKRTKLRLAKESLAKPAITPTDADTVEKKLLEEFRSSWKPDQAINPRDTKSFFAKYDSFLNYKCVQLVRVGLRRNDTGAITLRKYGDHPNYYDGKSIHMRSISKGTAEKDLESFKHDLQDWEIVVIDKLIRDCPDRVYLFSSVPDLPTQADFLTEVIGSLGQAVTKRLKKIDCFASSFRKLGADEKYQQVMEKLQNNPEQTSEIIEEAAAGFEQCGHTFKTAKEHYIGTNPESNPENNPENSTDNKRKAEDMIKDNNAKRPKVDESEYASKYDSEKDSRIAELERQLLQAQNEIQYFKNQCTLKDLTILSLVNRRF